MTHSLENDFLAIKVKSKGAELCSLINKQTGLEYLWQAGEAWPKHAPILFPIVGKLKQDTYTYKGNEYSMTQHGFARDYDFELSKISPEELVFTLKSTNETLLKYPFKFQLDISYKLNEDELQVEAQVANIGDEKMYFSIGFHPAFKIPLQENEQYSDYFLTFEKSENIQRWSIEGGLIGYPATTVLKDEKVIPLSYELFKNDAIVFKGLKSEMISIKNQLNNNGLDFCFNNFPFFGIWAKQNSDFVCLEPWQGIADSVETNQKIEEKEGIHTLAQNAVFICGYKVRSF